MSRSLIPEERPGLLPRWARAVNGGSETVISSLSEPSEAGERASERAREQRTRGREKKVLKITPSGHVPRTDMRMMSPAPRVAALQKDLKEDDCLGALSSHGSSAIQFHAQYPCEQALRIVSNSACIPFLIVCLISEIVGSQADMLRYDPDTCHYVLSQLSLASAIMALGPLQ